MQVRAYDNPGEFYQRVRPFLDGSEAENTVLIGILDRYVMDAKSAEALGWGRPLMLLVEDEDEEVVAVLLKTAVRKMLISRAPAIAVAMLADHLARKRMVLPGLVAPMETAQTFARAWRKLSSDTISLVQTLRLFSCNAVVAPPKQVSGSYTQPAADEMELFGRWMEDFDRDCEHEPINSRQLAEQQMAEGRLFVWRDPQPVSMAGFTARTARSARVVAVYTPPEFRNRGYASAVVAELTRRLLGSGLAHCLLFTDLGNPASNRVYQRIGYVAVADFAEYGFGGK